MLFIVFTILGTEIEWSSQSSWKKMDIDVSTYKEKNKERLSNGWFNKQYVVSRINVFFVKSFSNVIMMMMPKKSEKQSSRPFYQLASLKLILKIIVINFFSLLLTRLLFSEKRGVVTVIIMKRVYESEELVTRRTYTCNVSR